MGGVTPHLTVKNAARAIEFYTRVFGAKEQSRFAGPDGSIMHASLKIGDSSVLVNDEFPEMGNRSPQSIGGSPVFLMHYLPDVDATVKRAVEAGAKVTMPVADQFWGDRYGIITDPFGHVWELATHIEDLSKEEMDRRGREAMAQPANR
jgi:PhnB protein